jgi:hypothetical protein
LGEKMRATSRAIRLSAITMRMSVSAAAHARSSESAAFGDCIAYCR